MSSADFSSVPVLTLHARNALGVLLAVKDPRLIEHLEALQTALAAVHTGSMNLKRILLLAAGLRPAVFAVLPLCGIPARLLGLGGASLLFGRSGAGRGAFFASAPIFIRVFYNSINNGNDENDKVHFSFLPYSPLRISRRLASYSSAVMRLRS